MRLLLTRHGETEENKKGILQGWRQGTLTEKGKSQAKRLAQKLKDIHIDVIYTSDLKRCLDTARIIAQYRPNTIVIATKDLRERGLGVFEGRKVGREDWDALPGDFYNNRPKGGETYCEVWKRIKRFYARLLKMYGSETVLVVSHGGTLLLLQGVIQSLTIEQALAKENQKHAAISEFEITDKEYKMNCFNCITHLRGVNKNATP
ncbi:MAG TPA: histidine phosphatase family protein [Candidatus Nanoarchaeia archaeon]|nr:histidine phosphatase family protein [Candidatus Nanoarchaeia archaeon]